MKKAILSLILCFILFPVVGQIFDYTEDIIIVDVSSSNNTLNNPNYPFSVQIDGQTYSNTATGALPTTFTHFFVGMSRTNADTNQHILHTVTIGSATFNIECQFQPNAQQYTQTILNSTFVYEIHYMKLGFSSPSEICQDELYKCDAFLPMWETVSSRTISQSITLSGPGVNVSDLYSISRVMQNAGHYTAKFDYNIGFYGNTTKTITVTRPLTVLPRSPRLSAGSNITLTRDCNNYIFSISNIDLPSGGNEYTC